MHADEFQFIQERLSQAYNGKTHGELIRLTNVYNTNISEDKKLTSIDEICEGELADEELNNIAGGAEPCIKDAYPTVTFTERENVHYIFEVGNTASVYGLSPKGDIQVNQVVIIERRAFEAANGIWFDEYRVQPSGGNTWEGPDWLVRSQFKK